MPQRIACGPVSGRVLHRRISEKNLAYQVSWQICPAAGTVVLCVSCQARHARQWRRECAGRGWHGRGAGVARGRRASQLSLQRREAQSKACSAA